MIFSTYMLKVVLFYLLHRHTGRWTDFIRFMEWNVREHLGTNMRKTCFEIPMGTIDILYVAPQNRNTNYEPGS